MEFSMKRTVAGLLLCTGLAVAACDGGDQATNTGSTGTPSTTPQSAEQTRDPAAATHTPPAAAPTQPGASPGSAPPVQPTR